METRVKSALQKEVYGLPNAILRISQTSLEDVYFVTVILYLVKVLSCKKAFVMFTFK
jgi:hypothetical protein